MVVFWLVFFFFLHYFAEWLLFNLLIYHLCLQYMTFILPAAQAAEDNYVFLFNSIKKNIIKKCRETEEDENEEK